MIKYESNIFNVNKKCILTKEQYQKRKEALLKFHKEVGKQVRINEEREFKSLEYAKHKFVK